MKKLYAKGRKKATGTTAFYEFSQNNSGGGFHYDEESGLGHYVIVEAHSASEANSIAEGIGLYFDGYGDCSCCGDRWYKQYEGDGTPVPTHYGEELVEAVDEYRFDHTTGKPYIFVHYLNGIIEGWE